MRRLFWVAVGATAGVFVAYKVTRTAQRYKPAALAQRAGGVGEAVRGFTADVREGMAAREAELKYALGLTESGEPAGVSPDVVEHFLRSQVQRDTITYDREDSF